MSSFIKPILKWVGGKSQLLPSLMNYIPIEMENYHEPFIGGGSVLLLILQLQKEEKIKINKGIYAYDINKQLITVYKTIQQYPNELFAELEQIITVFNTLEKAEKSKSRKNIAKVVNSENKTTNKEYYYYWIRNLYNIEMCKTLEGEYTENSILISALFIFLNKTCFRGVYRVNKTSFNVPYGNYVKPEIINLDHLLLVSDLIKDVIFIHSSFEHSFMNFLDGDFIYVDPPYFPEKINSFVKYSNDGFSLSSHIMLFKLCGGITTQENNLITTQENNLITTQENNLITTQENNLITTQENIKIIMSNSNTEFVKKYFDNELFTIMELEIKRSIHSKDPSITASEVFIIKK
jgi:DNA adenine methylase